MSDDRFELDPQEAEEREQDRIRRQYPNRPDADGPSRPKLLMVPRLVDNGDHEAWREAYAREKTGQAERNRQRADDMAAAVRELKQSRDPEGEQMLLRRIREGGHPDVNGLVQSIRGRLEGSGKAKGRREL